MPGLYREDRLVKFSLRILPRGPQVDEVVTSVRKQRPAGRVRWLAAAGLGGGIAASWLAVMDLNAHGRLPDYQLALGYLSGSLAMVLSVSLVWFLFLVRPMRPMTGGRISKVWMLVPWAGLLLGFFGLAALMGASCHGRCGGGY